MFIDLFFASLLLLISHFTHQLFWVNFILSLDCVFSKNLTTLNMEEILFGRESLVYQQETKNQNLFTLRSSNIPPNPPNLINQYLQCIVTNPTENMQRAMGRQGSEKKKKKKLDFIVQKGVRDNMIFERGLFQWVKFFWHKVQYEQRH